MSGRWSVCGLCGSQMSWEDCENPECENSTDFVDGEANGETQAHDDKEPNSAFENLNILLFKQLHRLSDKNLTGLELKLEIERSKATAVLGMTLVNNVKLALEAQTLLKSGKLEALPKMVESDA